MTSKDSSISARLFSLAAIDKKIVEQTSARTEIEGRWRAMECELARREALLSQHQTACQHRQMLLKQEEELLASEESKILERRKQLQSIGGAKAAKIIERELEISGRSIQMLESRVTGAMDEVEKAKKRLALVEQAAAEIKETMSSELAGKEEKLTRIIEELKVLKKEREVVLTDLVRSDDKLLSIYERISSRYPSDPVALAKDGACYSCFRALPNQLYNLLLAGSRRIQCPGCSRLLVLSRDVRQDAA